jgi:hypothetical protein
MSQWLAYRLRQAIGAFRARYALIATPFLIGFIPPVPETPKKITFPK